jgi:hypothetical protein
VLIKNTSKTRTRFLLIEIDIIYFLIRSRYYSQQKYHNNNSPLTHSSFTINKAKSAKIPINQSFFINNPSSYYSQSAAKDSFIPFELLYSPHRFFFGVEKILYNTHSVVQRIREINRLVRWHFKFHSRYQLF